MAFFALANWSLKMKIMFYNVTSFTTASRSSFVIPCLLVFSSPSLPFRLAASKGDILEDTALVTSLEHTKATAEEIAAKRADAKVAETRLTSAREVYRPVAARGALAYFFMDSLQMLNRIYWFSMGSFLRIMRRSMAAAPALPPEEGLTWRVNALVDAIGESVFRYLSPP